MVNNSTDALNAINSVKYPPEGNRGVGLYRAKAMGKILIIIKIGLKIIL